METIAPLPSEALPGLIISRRKKIEKQIEEEKRQSTQGWAARKTRRGSEDVRKMRTEERVGGLKSVRV